MGLIVNLRHLAAHDLHLQGSLPVAELDLDTRDEMIQVDAPLEYDLEAQKVEDGLLLQGSLKLPLHCQCVRCLKPFAHLLCLKEWKILVPLEGEEAAPAVSDCVDLTPYLREDILLELPQHPVCAADCGGLQDAAFQEARNASGGPNESSASAWTELNKLKF